MILRRCFFVCLLTIGLLAAAPLSAQDAPSDPTGGGLDPVTTPAPLPTRAPRPAPSATVTGDGVTLQILFDALEQGGVGTLHVTGQTASGAPISAVRARFLNDEEIDFYPMPDDSPTPGWWGVLSVNMEQRTGPAADLSVFVTFADETTTSLTTELTILLGGFIAQDVTVPPDRAYLLDIETERNELARLESLYSPRTPERRWGDDGFQMPILSALTSPFGAFRTFNATLNTRHTGWDIRTTLGQPVLASAAGRVVFTGFLEIRGQYVLIDHGYGIYSGYAHLSTTHVTRGQDVTRGQVLGTVGDSGRVSGPHFHWEMAVNGNWVDSVEFIQLWLP